MRCKRIDGLDSRNSKSEDKHQLLTAASKQQPETPEAINDYQYRDIGTGGRQHQENDAMSLSGVLKVETAASRCMRKSLVRDTFQKKKTELLILGKRHH